jgi:hypothetical protein
MSIPVDPDQLAQSVAEYGPTAYLLTSDDDGRPRVTQVMGAISKNRVVVAAGGSASRNAKARPAVTMLWPPVDDGGFSLIADGVAEVDDPGPGAIVEVVVTSAVLHRRAQPVSG